MTVVIRPATPLDASALADIYLASRKIFLPYAPLAHTDAEVREWIANVLTPSGGVTVAIALDKPIGMMARSHDGPLVWIDHLYLHPSVVGQGLGSQLLERAKQESASLIRLYTFQANTAARRFYERHGFRPIAFSDGAGNEERCPDVLYEFNSHT